MSGSSEASERLARGDTPLSWLEARVLVPCSRIVLVSPRPGERHRQQSAPARGTGGDTQGKHSNSLLKLRLFQKRGNPRGGRGPRAVPRLSLTTSVLASWGPCS